MDTVNAPVTSRLSLRPVAIVASLLLALPAAAAPPSSGTWSASTWQRDLAAAADEARAENPAAWTRLHKLEGLRPEVYLRKRRPEPNVERELAQLVSRGEVPAALIAALLVSGLDDYPVSSRGDFPDHVKGQETALIARERDQLEDGLLLALGASGHPSAPFVVASWLDDAERDPAHRRIAAIALGKTGSELAVSRLVRLAQNEKLPTQVRTGALQGLGHVRTPAALDALLGSLAAGGATPLRVATAAAVGQCASSWVKGVSDPMRERAARGLVDALVENDDRRVAGAVVDALAVVQHPGSLELLAAAQRAHTAPDVTARLARAERRLTRALRRAR